MYQVESFNFNTASQAADCVISNADWHHLCEAGITEEEYQQAIWCLRNFIREQIENLGNGESAKISGIEIRCEYEEGEY
jgi:hypothetical protein